MPASIAHMEATKRFEKKAYDQFVLRVRKDVYENLDFIRDYAERRGESVNSFIKRAVEETIERDRLKLKG